MAERIRPPGPFSLLARTNLTLTISSLLIALISTLALNFFVIGPIAERAASDEAALLVLSAQTWVELPPEARPYFELELAQNHDLIVNAVPRDLPAIEPDPPFLNLLVQQLVDRLNTPITLLAGDDLNWVNVPMGGVELQIGFSPERPDIQPLYGGILIVVLGALIVFGTSLSIVRRIARPLVHAAEGVEAFRGGEDFEALPEEGPAELVSLARNFNTMARNISTLLSNRTTLLAGISHDLRTPLTRMRLALELLPADVDQSLVARFERNLTAMESLITDALRFARGTGESRQEVELLNFIREIVESHDASIPFHAQDAEGIRLMLAPGALQRVLINLINNAQQHGDAVEVAVRGREIHVCDSGPGIPDEYKERVFQPFFRIDSSRSVATGGSGLGLAIVQQLCQAQGWRVRIEDGKQGGTEVILSLG